MISAVLVFLIIGIGATFFFKFKEEQEQEKGEKFGIWYNLGLYHLIRDVLGIDNFFPNLTIEN